jgi:arylsulfatase A-like enzyme
VGFTLRLALVAATLCLASGCARDERADEGRPAELQGAVLILLDTVRADHLGCYGYDRRTSPHIDALAHKGVRFEQAIATSPWTLPSVVSLLTGEYAERVLPGKVKRSLMEIFQQAGFATAAVTEGGFVSSAFGLDTGFGDFKEEKGPIQLVGPRRRPDASAVGGIARTFELAKEWLARHREERFFLLIHTYEPHTPYNRRTFARGMDSGAVGPVFRASFLTALQTGQTVLSREEIDYVTALYDGGILESDRHVGELLAFLEATGLGDRTLVAVTSDHGEELGDQYPANTGDHGHSLRDPLLAVPLVLYDPVHDYAVREVSAQVRLLDTLPTIAEILGVKIDRAIDGTSAVPLMDGSDSEDRLVLASQTKRGPLRAGVRTLGFKFIATLGPGGEETPLLDAPPAQQLYDLADDTKETRNRVADRPELAQALLRILSERFSGLGEELEPDYSDDIDPGVLERLKSLGYIR